MAAVLHLGVVRMRGCVVRDHIVDRIIQVVLSPLLAMRSKTDFGF
jgi:hypothetical protein